MHLHMSGPESMGFTHPPWCLIATLLQRVQHQRATLVLISPVWPTQPWYLIVLSLLIDLPVLLPHPLDTILPSPNCDNALQQSPPQLAAWRVSDNNLLHREFRQTLSNLSCHPGGRKQTPTTTQLGESGNSGVMKEMSIPFQHLFQSFLTKQFQDGKQYSFLNCYRSAISSTHLPIEGFPIEKHLLVTCLCAQ